MNAPFTTPIRTAPHNIEAEQALLGAILVNNEAFYRVSDFLEPKHFLEGIHQRIYEIAGDLIRAGKLATPVTLKTFLPGDLDVASRTDFDSALFSAATAAGARAVPARVADVTRDGASFLVRTTSGSLRAMQGR